MRLLRQVSAAVYMGLPPLKLVSATVTSRELTLEGEMQEKSSMRILEAEIIDHWSLYRRFNC